MMAITHAERVARWCARPLEWFRHRLHPVIWALNSASNFVVTRILRIEVEGDSEAATAEELRVLIGRGGARASSTRARPTCWRASSTCTSRRRAR